MSITTLISFLRNVTLYDALSVRSIIIQHLSTVKIRFDVTSALELIALITILLRTLIRAQSAFFTAALIT